jgi:glycosyltransferase involved in cell wall biosynthesis
MRIGVNALGLIPGEIGGAETYLRRTLEAMARLFPEHEFIVFGNTENRLALAEDLRDHANATLVDLRFHAMSRIRRVVKEQFVLPRLLRRAGVDVLWNPGYVTPLRAPCPRLTAVLDMQYKRFPEDFPPAGLRATRFLVGAALRRSEGLVTISEFSRQEILTFSRVPFDRIAVTPLAVDECFATPLPGRLLAERVMALLHGADPYVLCISNSYPHKSLQTAVEAFGRIMADIPHRLVMVGQPRLGEPAVEAAIAALPQAGRVVRLRYVAKQDLVALYQAADAFVFPSKYEGFGLPVLEAMKAGLPVVAARAGATPEVGGDAIRYVPPGDAEALAAELRKVLYLPQEERAALTAAARARAASFSWDATARGTVAACLRLVSSEGVLP